MAQTAPEKLLYSKEHEWVAVDGDVATVGITDYAQSSLGDIVYVELPRVGSTLTQFANIGVIESVKAVSDVFTPVGGEVIGINAEIENDPAVVNREPYGGGWLFKVKLSDVSQLKDLMGADQYELLVSEA
jgi:glycine cleavage system H protein